MIEIGDALKEYLSQGGRTFSAEIRAGKSGFSDIMSLKKEQTVCTGSFSLGNVNVSFVEASLYGVTDNIGGCEIEPIITAEVNNEEYEISLGVYKVEKPKTESGVTTFTAYDKIKYNTNGVYKTMLGSSAKIDAVFFEVCNMCGMEYVPLFSAETPEADKPDINPELLDGMTFNAVLGQIAGFMGGNIICNSEGKIEVRYFSTCSSVIDEDMCSDPEIGDDVFVLNGIACINGDNTITSGNIISYSFENVLMTQAQLDKIYDRYSGLSYNAVSVENLVGNPCLEVGDIITVCGKNVPVMRMTIDFDGGILNEIEAFHETDEEQSSRLVTLPEKLKNIEENSKKYSDALNAAQNSLIEKMNNALGIYSTQKNVDGSTIYYFHDKENIAESTYIFTFNSEGFAWAKGYGCWNGGNPKWQYGIDSTGGAILETLLVRSITADIIKAGILKSNDGKTYFDLENSELITESEETEDETTIRTVTKLRSGQMTVSKYSGDNEEPASAATFGNTGAFLSAGADDDNDPDFPKRESGETYIAYLVRIGNWLKELAEKGLSGAFSVLGQNKNGDKGFTSMRSSGVTVKNLSTGKSSSYRADGATVDGNMEVTENMGVAGDMYIDGALKFQDNGEYKNLSDFFASVRRIEVPANDSVRITFFPLSSGTITISGTTSESVFGAWMLYGNADNAYVYTQKESSNISATSSGRTITFSNSSTSTRRILNMNFSYGGIETME